MINPDSSKNKMHSIFLTRPFYYLSTIFLYYSTPFDKLYCFYNQIRTAYCMMANKKITQLRIHKQVQSIEREPIPSVIVTQQDLLNFHFCFYDLQQDFKGGYYHGLMELPEDYPFSPPKIKFYTNNGRFQVGRSICTTFTHYHKETWSSSWNIKTILTALISFMYTNQKGIGGVFETPSKRRLLANKSLQENMKNEKFVQLFKTKILELKLITPERWDNLISGKPQKTTRRRRRQRSQTTNVQELKEVPEINEINLTIGNIVEEDIEIQIGKPTAENGLYGKASIRKRIIYQQPQEQAMPDEGLQDLMIKKVKMNENLSTQKELAQKGTTDSINI